jgi:hypothetical protein
MNKFFNYSKKNIMRKYSLHLLTVMFILTVIASFKKEAIPKDKIAAALRNAQSVLSEDKSNYYPKNCSAKNAILIPGLPGLVAQFHPSFHLKYSSHDNG